jgi:hypothetical protein
LWPGRKQCRGCLDAWADHNAFYKAIKQGVTTMPRFKTEEGKRRWLDAMAKRRGEKRKGGGSTAVVPAKSTALAVKPSRTVDAVDGVVLDLDAAIARRRDELAVLEHAKEIVLRG